ncbi:MAG: type II secretion system F family protein, partial [bacterium]
MPTYQFEAMDQTGKTVKETIEATSQEEAQQLIRQRGFFVTSIGEKSKTKAKANKKKGRRKKKSFTIGKIKPKQLCTFTRQLSTLQDAGLPILRSLKILEAQCKPGVLKNSLADVVEDIESGLTLSEAFAKHPKAFDRL